LKYKTCLTAWAYILNFLESHTICYLVGSPTII
jgi:hypothetical protein